MFKDDELLDEEGKTEVVSSMMTKWVQGELIEPLLISAEKKENMDVFRQRLLGLVKEQYKIRYPYQAKQW